MEHLVSVIINCFNGERFIRDAVKSVIDQSYGNWEIIFWDNQSSDSSLEACKEFKDPRIKIYESESHTLLYEARNRALKKANGAYIAFLDVDDKWLPNKLTEQIKIFEDESVGCVYGNYLISNELKKSQWLAHRYLHSGFITDQLLEKYSVGLLTLVVRRSAMSDYDRFFDGSYHIIGDYDAVMRLSTSTKIAAVQNPVAIYRIHGENEFGKSRKLYLREMERWLASAKDMPKISNALNFPKLQSQLQYIRAVNNLMEGNRMQAVKLAFRIKNKFMLAKIFIISLLPIKLMRYLKNN